MALPRSALVKPKLPDPTVATTRPQPPVFTPPELDAASEPSRGELVARAAAVGPMRMAWESVVVADDPILSEKRLPHVAERRARLTRVVKMTLGVCLAVCVLALVVSASSGGSESTASASSSVTPALGKMAPSEGATPVEAIDASRRGKAARRLISAATTAARASKKRR